MSEFEQWYADNKDKLHLTDRLAAQNVWQAAKQSMQGEAVAYARPDDVDMKSYPNLAINYPVRTKAEGEYTLPLYTHAPDIAELQAQVESLRKDAELMRWLRDNNATVYPVEEQKRGYRSTEPNAKPEVWYERIGWNVSAALGNVYKTMDEAIYAAISKGGE